MPFVKEELQICRNGTDISLWISLITLLSNSSQPHALFFKFLMSFASSVSVTRFAKKALSYFPFRYEEGDTSVASILAAVDGPMFMKKLLTEVEPVYFY